MDKYGVQHMLEQRGYTIMGIREEGVNPYVVFTIALGDRSMEWSIHQLLLEMTAEEGMKNLLEHELRPLSDWQHHVACGQCSEPLLSVEAIVSPTDLRQEFRSAKSGLESPVLMACPTVVPLV
jgi:hypothetical protein